MDAQVESISRRMDLRIPLGESLAILAEICGRIELTKEQPVADALAAIRGKYATVKDFERDFPSLCFNIATGVGKTRLMGAFITYLYKVWGIRHFFVLAPNLTIYNKLITDFTPNMPKYVLANLAEFATNPPEIITGDNYESGRGVRNEARAQRKLGDDTDVVHINIFNISKINSEVRGGKAPRIKRLSEYIGQSYFDYLSGLDDLVLLMDESHRYRASAGLRAINELRPVLGLELTATPQVMEGKTAIQFQNIVYHYLLANAMKDGYVKEPAVATRRNYGESSVAEMDAMKLEDGLRVHEHTKIALEAYAHGTGKPLVKPFVLVIARDTTHADQLGEQLQSAKFCDGKYAGKTLVIHTNLDTAEGAENLEKLLSVERVDNPIEVVVHVNMLSEGWDVKNLYTIIPLKAADSKTLVEQSIGRGLRLPYGTRTGVAEVDRLTIVAHDKFDEIVRYARETGSIIRQVYIGEDIPDATQVKVEALPRLTYVLTGATQIPQVSFKPEEKDIALTVNDILENGTAGISMLSGLSDEDNRAKLVQEAKERLPPSVTPKQIELVIQKVQKAREFLTIEVPHILVQPNGEVTVEYQDFDLDTNGINVKPVKQEILIQQLEDEKAFTIHLQSANLTPVRPEDLLVYRLMDFNDVNYGRDRRLLYKLAKQMVDHLRSYLKTPDEVDNVLRYHRRQLVDAIHDQMTRPGHVVQRVQGWEVKPAERMNPLTPKIWPRSVNEPIRDLRSPPEDKRTITRYVFNGFTKCLFNEMKFQSDTERVFAIILEKDPEVEKWTRPSKRDFPVYYEEGGYVPDFVVETKTAKFVCETKAANELDAPDVEAKTKAILEWCARATEFEGKNGGKPWHYLLVPHDVVRESATLKGLAAAHTRQMRVS